MKIAQFGSSEPEMHGIGQSLRIIAKFLDKDGSLELDRIRQAWRAEVGPPLSESTWPLGAQGENLRVAAATPAARVALVMASARILAALRDKGFGFTKLEAEVRSANRRK